MLVPVIERPEPTLLFTRRTEHLPSHAGQVSFPGGRFHASDASLTVTALRETEEEIGLNRRHVELLGHLGEYHTITGFRVTPVAGLVLPPFELKPDDFEVAEIFEVPLSFLMDAANRQLGAMLRQGRPRYFHAVPYKNYYIWGATAAMLLQFKAFLIQIME